MTVSGAKVKTDFLAKKSIQTSAKPKVTSNCNCNNDLQTSKVHKDLVKGSLEDFKSVVIDKLRSIENENNKDKCADGIHMNLRL